MADLYSVHELCEALDVSRGTFYNHIFRRVDRSKYEEEKLNAIKQYMGKKDADFESELNEVLGKMYEKYVPQAVREYIESRGDVPPAIKKSNKSSVRNIAPSAGLGKQNE